MTKSIKIPNFHQILLQSSNESKQQDMNCRTRRTYNVKIGYILQNDETCAVERQDIYCR